MSAAQPAPGAGAHAGGAAGLLTESVVGAAQPRPVVGAAAERRYSYRY